MSDMGRKCSLDYCTNQLSSLSSIAMGMCEQHQKELESDKYLVGVCWNCNRITVIDEIPRKLKDVYKEKYIFTKGCTHCTIDGEDNAWLTLKRFQPKEELVVTPTGTLERRSKQKDRIAETEQPGLEDANVA